MFLESCGEVIRVLCGNEEGNWVISYDNPCTPKFVLRDDLRTMERIEPPKDFQMRMTQEQTPGQKKRQELISELLEEESYVWDRTGRNTKIREIAARENTSERRIRELYFRALAGRALVEERKKAEKEETKEEKDFLWAIDTFYYTAKKFSLRSAYDMLLLSRYTDPDGHLLNVYPSWHTFRHYFYDKNFHKKSRNLIARNGLTDYQRNKRPLFGSASAWKEQIGVFQMDATQADIYLVSRLDRFEVIGRPYIYLAVDTATQLIAGVYVGMDAGEQAVINCLSNAAADKVSFCKRYGLDIKKEEWPNTGLPGEIITDKGREFIGTRMNELAMKYGIEFESLPPFRPDGKGLVEKSFDLIQQRYKPALRGKGVIEADAQERWAVDYRSQAVLTLEEFTKVILSCILYLNSCRVIENRFCKDADPVAAAMWMECEKEKRSLVIPINSEELYRFGLPRTSATLNRRGICYQGLWYVSENYKEFLENHNIGETVRICYDPEDVSRLFLLNGMNYIPFGLSRHSKQYAGATESEYQMKRKAERDSRKETELRDTEGRIRLLKDIESVVKQAEYRDKNKISTKRMEQAKEMERA